MDHMNPFDDKQSLRTCDNDDTEPPAGWVSAFALWEDQTVREAEDSADQVIAEKEAINQRLWLLFQASACSIAQLYKDRTHGQTMWLPFQVAASNVTTMFRECVESQKKMNELCLQAGVQRRNREILSWIKKRKRPLIRQEDLIAFVCGKNSDRKDRHHTSGRSPRRVAASDPINCTGANSALFSNATADHRLVHSRSPPQILSCLSLSDPASDAASGLETSATAAASNLPATDLQPFRDALALSTFATNASSTITSSNGRRSNRNFAQVTSPDAADLEELNAFITAEFTRNVDSKKRSFPVNDVVMSSPTHKRPKFL